MRSRRGAAGVWRRAAMFQVVLVWRPVFMKLGVEVPDVSKVS